MFKIDLHLHTIASGHAHNTILEYINQAKRLKMKSIGISEHGPKNEETIVSEIYFGALSRMPKYINGIRILKGIEANIINKKGDLDIGDKSRNELDYVMANIHPYAGYSDLGMAGNTKTLINTIKSGKINVVTHPFWTRIFDVDVKKISEEACRNNVLLEMNVHYAAKYKDYAFVISNLKIIIDTVKKYKMKVIIGSDSHNIWELGDDSPIKTIKKDIGLTEDLIINNYPKELFKLLKINE